MSVEPERISQVADAGLKIRWSDRHESLYPAAQLRAECPCAACREGGPPPVNSAMKFLQMTPVGRYAVGIRFSDGHSTGIFSFEFLRSICPCEECRPQQFTEG